MQACVQATALLAGKPPAFFKPDFSERGWVPGTQCEECVLKQARSWHGEPSAVSGRADQAAIREMARGACLHLGGILAVKACRCEVSLAIMIGAA